MNPLRSAGNIRVFISSGIAEFKEERKLLHQALNGEKKLEPYEVWIYEHTAAEALHERDFYLGELEKSKLAVFIFGQVIKGGTEEEYKKAVELQMDRHIYLVDASIQSDVERQLGPLGRKYLSGWSTPNELVEWIIDGIANHTSRVYQRLETLKISARINYASPDVPVAYQLASRALAKDLRDGNIDQAFKKVRKLSESPSSPSDKVEAKNLLAFCLRYTGQYDSSISEYKQLYEETSQARFGLNIALTYLMSNQLDQANDWMSRLESDAVKLPLFPIVYSQIALAQGDIRKAASVLQNRRSEDFLDRFGHDYWSIKGDIASREARSWRAAACFLRAVEYENSMAPVAYARAAFQFYNIAVDVGREDILEVADKLLKLSETEYKSTMLHGSERTHGFRKFMATTRAAILHGQHRAEEALELLESFEKENEVDDVFRYNIAVFRYELYGIKPTIDLIRAAAIQGHEESLWFNLVSTNLVPFFNGQKDNREQLDKDVIEYESLFPNSNRLAYIKGTILLAEGRMQEGLNLLRSVWEDASRPVVVRINAINNACVFACNRGTYDQAVGILDEAFKYELENFDLMAGFAKYFVVIYQRNPNNSGPLDRCWQITGHLLHTALLEKKRFGVANADVFRDIGYWIFRCARILGFEAECATLIEEFAGQLLPSRSKFLLEGMSESMV